MHPRLSLIPLLTALLLGSPLAAAQTTPATLKGTGTGERIPPTGKTVAEIRGWMTLGQVAKAFKVQVRDILAAFRLPATTKSTAPLNTLGSKTFTVTALKSWITKKTGVK